MAEVRRGRKISWLTATDRQLAQGVVDDDIEARAEASRRFFPLAVLHARRFCSRIGHRGGHCPGYGGEGCSEAFTIAVAEIMKKVIGVGPQDRRGPDNNCELARFLSNPRGEDPESFAQHFSRCGMNGWATDVLRAWNADRGLRQRPRSSTSTKQFEESFAEWTKKNPTCCELHDAGFRFETDPIKWLQALYNDACQPRANLFIDGHRVCRELLEPDQYAQLDKIKSDVLSVMFLQLDTHIELTAPIFHADYLVAARNATGVDPTDELHRSPRQPLSPDLAGKSHAMNPADIAVAANSEKENKK